MADNEIASLDSAPGQDLNGTKRLNYMRFVLLLEPLLYYRLPIELEPILIENKGKMMGIKNVEIKIKWSKLNGRKLSQIKKIRAQSGKNLESPDD